MKTVTVCIYSHRHGVDVSLYTTPEAAFEGAAKDIVAFYVAEEVSNPHLVEKIQSMIRDGQYEDAVDAFNLAQQDVANGESIEFRTGVEIESGARQPVLAKCPNCGNSDVEEIEVTETFRAYHPIRSLEDGVLSVENALTTSNPAEHCNDGSGDWTAYCRACHHEGTITAFGLPVSTGWEWV